MTEFSLPLDLSGTMGAFHSSEDPSTLPRVSKHLADSEGRTRGLLEACSLGSQPVPGPAFQPADGHRGRAAGQRREGAPQGPEKGNVSGKVYKSDPSLAL